MCTLEMQEHTSGVANTDSNTADVFYDFFLTFFLLITLLKK